MTQDTSDQQADRWKQQYYDHLDLLDQKQQDWQVLESVLKKAVLRLSIAAEGQHATIDRYLHEIRAQIKEQINVNRLDSTLADISALVLKMGDKSVATDRKVIATLARLLEKIDLPDIYSKQKSQLIKKLSRSSDNNSDELADEMQVLLSTAIRQADSSNQQNRTGLLNKLFKSQVDNGQSNHTDNNTDTENHRPQRPDIEKLPVASELVTTKQNPDENSKQPSAQDILIRLLQQLIVPPDLHQEVESLKQGIEIEHSSSGWKSLLKDVARLINTLRSRMQDEKHEFESFLQQITGRLKEIDSFLLIENTSLLDAEQAAGTFDAVVSAQVQDIHDEMNSADNLNDLKNMVEKRLNVVSDHIRQYRIDEQARFSRAQKNVENMQSRLALLEQESDELRKLIQVKNREAMFDVLTGIPNRLSYEKKATEEIARCNRFAVSLSMVVWDIDLFKQVNDRHGHKVGDTVLKAIAQLLSDRMRQTDFIARYGGEEFVMFLPGANEAKALELADRLREKIAGVKFNNHGQTVNVTVSCGITCFIKGDDHETMFERADKALYAAKHSGRNRCMLASSLTG